MCAARARTGGGSRPFRPDEYASMRTVSDVAREELLADPHHPKIRGERAIDCECGHADIGEHNAAVTGAARRRGVL
ncbi:MAG: hypothetical protein M3N18_05925 [Actinomycetota bacterium]|nr:hypothetical protein [Actinomycetota bacterium]